jgi:hypothetical protein
MWVCVACSRFFFPVDDDDDDDDVVVVCDLFVTVIVAPAVSNPSSRSLLPHKRACYAGLQCSQIEREARPILVGVPVMA